LHLTLSVYNGFKLVVTELNAGSVLRRQISASSAAARGWRAAVGVSGVLRATDPLGMAVQYRLDGTRPGQPAGHSMATRLGDLNALNIVTRAQSLPRRCQRAVEGPHRLPLGRRSVCVL
jgi:hypothetical protein